jgi:hypothetical protein
MSTDELKLSEDVSEADWIAPRLTGAFGAVTLAVPNGYAAYARICHPATDTDNSLVSWPEVARQTGRKAHPLMQWHALVGSRDPFNFTGSQWSGGDPERGNLRPEILGPLCELLAHHTSTREECCFCVWEGYGWLEDGRLRARPSSRAEVRQVRLERRQLRVGLPDRDYVLLSGPLSAAPEVGSTLGAPGFAPHSPNLFWPADRAWCVASEIDFDSTLVGGTKELVEAILNGRAFDAWPMRPDDSLAYDADVVNVVGE